MQHFNEIHNVNVMVMINGRRIYLRKRYFQTEFNNKGFWKEDAYYNSWRVRYNNPYKKFKLKKYF